jgi:fibronectin-binding autotransporter adhesin
MFEQNNPNTAKTMKTQILAKCPDCRSGVDRTGEAVHRVSIPSRRLRGGNATLWAACLAARLAFPLHAAHYSWLGGTGTYNNPANWSGGVVPGPGDTARNDMGTNQVVLINADDPDWTVIDFLAGTGVGTSGAFTQNARVASSTGWFRMGVETGSLGIYTLNGGTLNVLGGRINLGEKGTGILNINGGLINKSGDIFVLGDGGWSGSATGIVNQTAGEIRTSSELWVGQVAGGVGQYNLSGGQLNSSNWLVIARAKSVGTFNMTGGAINKTAAGPFVIGENTGARGTLNHSAGTITSDADLWIGQFQSFGTNNVSGTAVQNINSWLVVGRAGGTGQVNMVSGTINKGGPVDRHFILAAGANSMGIINQSGGVINDTTAGSEVWIGEGDGAMGIWNLSGNATANLGVVMISYSGASIGQVSLLSGGVMAAMEVRKGSTAPVSTGTLIFDGGTLRARASNPNFLHDLTTATIQSGGATIDSQGFDIGIAQALGGNGGLTKIGPGTLTLTAVNTFSGPTAVNQGTLAVNGSLAGGSVTVAGGATLAGTGIVGGPVTVNGAITPGTSVGTLTLQSDLNLASSAQLTFELDQAGIVGSGVNDLISVGGNLVLDGTLNIVGLANFGVGTYRLINYAGTLTDNGLVLGTLSGNANNTFLYQIQAGGGEVNLIVGVPEPTTLSLAFLGALGGLAARFRRHQA